MRPLNRPMFRYGGPIKEGVMSGIREPHKNGERVGYGLVGDKRYPRTDGREHHWAFVPWLGSMLLGAGGRMVGGQAVKKVGQKVIPKVVQKVSNLSSTPANMRGIFDMGSKKIVKDTVKDKGIPAAATGWKNIGKNWFSGDPTVKGAKWGWKTLTSPGANTLAQKAVKMAISPTTVIGGALYYLWPDGTKRKTPPPGGTGGATGQKPWESNVGMKGDGSWFDAQAEKENKIAKQKEWNNRIKKYRDIMDIKGMNKQAAYKSLVDASKIIQESGDFKGDIRSGKLINEVIQAASKQFDKPKATSDAINTLILQNELKKDLNKEENALDKAYKQSALALNEAKLAENSLAGDIRSYTVKNQSLPSGNTLAGFATNRGYSIKGVEDTTTVKTWMKENNGTEVDYLQSTITDKEVAPGLYVINDKILQIDESKKVTPVSIS